MPVATAPAESLKHAASQHEKLSFRDHDGHPFDTQPHPARFDQPCPYLKISLSESIHVPTLTFLLGFVDIYIYIIYTARYYIHFIIFWINHDFDEGRYTPKYLQSFWTPQHLMARWRAQRRCASCESCGCGGIQCSPIPQRPYCNFGTCATWQLAFFGANDRCSFVWCSVIGLSAII